MVVFSQQDLKNILEHKYQSGNSTWLDKKMYIFWNYVVDNLPMWLAPNLITLLGFVCQLVAFFIVYFHDPSFSSTKLPGYLFFVCALGIFGHQTTDAVDGQQARRTKSSSPMGQIMDHGLDFVGFLLWTQTFALALGYSQTMTIYSYVLIQLPYLVAEIYEYSLGKHAHQTGNVGVTEGEFVVMSAFIITGIFGQEFWINNTIGSTLQMILPSSVFQTLSALPLASIVLSQSLNIFYTFATVWICLFISIGMLYNTLIETTNKTKTFLALIPAIYFSILDLIWLYFDFFNLLPALSLIGIGSFYCLYTLSVLLVSVTKAEKIFLRHVQVIPGLMTAFLVAFKIWGASARMMKFSMIGCVALGVGVFIFYFISMIIEIRDFCGLKVFSIGKTKKN